MRRRSVCTMASAQRSTSTKSPQAHGFAAHDRQHVGSGDVSTPVIAFRVAILHVARSCTTFLSSCPAGVTYPYISISGGNGWRNNPTLCSNGVLLEQVYVPYLCRFISTNPSAYPCIAPPPSLHLKEIRAALLSCLRLRATNSPSHGANRCQVQQHVVWYLGHSISPVSINIGRDPPSVSHRGGRRTS